jgi:hypothetical protein
MFSEMLMMEKKDACYYKVKASAKVWPSAYASGRLVQCRKKGAANYGNKSESVAEGTAETPQQQQVRAAINKGMEKWDQNDKATYQSQPTKANYMPASGYASDKLTGVDSIDPDGTVVLAINDTKADGIVKKLATLGGMPGVKTRQIQPKIVQGMAENIRVEPVARSLKTQSTQTQPKQNVYVAPDKKTPAVVNHIKPQGLAEGLHPMVIDDVKKLATLNPVDRYSAYSNIRSYFKADPALSKMASDIMGGYYEADMLRGKYKTDAAKAKYAELEPMHQAFIKQALGQEQGMAEGKVTKTTTGLRHRATDKYGAGDDEPHHYTGGRSGFSNPGKYARDLEHVDKQQVKNLDASMGITWKNRGAKGVEVDEDMSRRGFLRGLGAAALGAAGVAAAGNAQARATPEWMEKVAQSKELLSKGLTPEQVAKKLGVTGPNNNMAGPMGGDWGAINYAVREVQRARGTGMNEEGYNPEYDDEAGMADNNLETLRRAVDGLDDVINTGDNLPEWCQEKIAVAKSMLVSVWDYMRSEQDRGANPELAEEFDLIESCIDRIADHNGVDAEMIWEDLESLSHDELYVFAVTSEPIMEDWQKANKSDRTAGMSQKAVNAYRRENPGSKLQTAVTTKPSKLKKGSKSSKRRKSYCSRSRGQMKMHNISCAKTPDKAICKARRRWNC